MSGPFPSSSSVANSRPVLRTSQQPARAPGADGGPHERILDPARPLFLPRDEASATYLVNSYGIAGARCNKLRVHIHPLGRCVTPIAASYIRTHQAISAMAISTWSARLLLTPASSRATLSPPRPPTTNPLSSFFPRNRLHFVRPRPRPPCAYISAPAPGPEAAYAPPSLDATAAAADVAAAISSSDAVTWAGVWALLSRHRARIAVCIAALVACTTCTLSMPLFSGEELGRWLRPLGCACAADADAACLVF